MASNQVLGTDKAIRLNDYTLAGLVQTHDFAPEFAPTQINEMGNNARVDVSYMMETKGSFELMSSGNTAGMLARMMVARTAGAFTGFVYTPGGAPGKNAYTFTQSSLSEMQFDIVVHEKPDQQTYSRSVWIPRCFLTQFSGKADSNGMATETYQWAGQYLEAFVTPYHDIRSTPCTVKSASTTEVDPIDATVTGATYTLAYVMVDDRVFRTVNTDATYVTLDPTNPKITFTTTEGYAVPATAVVRALVYKTVGSTTFPTLAAVDRGTSAFSMRGYNTNIYIAPATASAPSDSEKWLKVQSVSWDVNLRVDTLRQIQKNDQGNTIYARLPQYPIETSLSVTTNESDWADWKRLLSTVSGTTKTFAGTTVYDSSYTFAPKYMNQNFAIVIEYWSKDGSTKLQSWRFTDCYISGQGERATVNGKTELTWQAKGSAFTLQGYNG